ncbi:hypothetical protein F5X97DRAFT_88447 [Nemania serpens]|nr:hypothetical protein F5X97DRAFT_88447 [Nemania serpens]
MLVRTVRLHSIAFIGFLNAQSKLAQDVTGYPDNIESLSIRASRAKWRQYSSTLMDFLETAVVMDKEEKHTKFHLNRWGFGRDS